MKKVSFCADSVDHHFSKKMENQLITMYAWLKTIDKLMTL